MLAPRSDSSRIGCGHVQPKRGVPTMMERRWHRSAALAARCATVVAALAALAVLSLEAAAQIPAAAPARQAAPISYSRAEQLLNWHTTLLVSGDEVVPQWLPDGNRFWYRNKTPAGAEFV